ncbi:MAG: VOC family protein [Pseudomonas sp.]|uniref:VOC family protein n=1 Tax=Pseudomonas sp. TaxID=306 RepID=UPI003394BF8F
MSTPEHDRRIDYIEFGATQLEPIKSFYAKAFGWTFTDYGPHYSSFSDGRLEGGFTTDSPVGQGALIVLYASDLEACLERVRAAGGQILQAIFSFPGGRRFEFADPSGNRLAVWSQ